MDREQQRALATRFIELQKQNQVIPPDDRDLDLNSWWDRFVTRTLSWGCLRHMQAVEELVNQAPISPYFRTQLILETALGYRTGWTRPEKVEEMNELMYGISLEGERYGFFDPALAEDVEREVFQSILPVLKLREQRENFNPVSWQDWEKHLSNQHST